MAGFNTPDGRVYSYDLSGVYREVQSSVLMIRGIDYRSATQEKVCPDQRSRLSI